MEYLEVIETVIPFVIKRILLGVEDKIYGGLEVTTSATYSVDLAFNMMYQNCFDPYFQNQKDNEDVEATSTQKERFRSYDIKDVPPLVPKTTPKIELPPHHEFMMPTQLWDSYEPQLVKQPVKEYIEEYPNERRIMEQKCFEKSNKEQMLRERSREKRQMKEQYTRLIQSIGTKDYTFDYNCDPLAQSNNQTRREMYQKLPFDVPLNEGNQIIHKPKLIEQIKQKRRQAENEETIIEFMEAQPQEIKLQPGVKLNLIPIFPKEGLQRQLTSQSKQQEQMIGTPLLQKKKYRNIVRLNDLQLAGYLQQWDADISLENMLMQNTNKTQAITPTNRSMFDQQALKQDVPKLPKLRSHSINARTKRKSRTQQTYSIITYRE